MKRWKHSRATETRFSFWRTTWTLTLAGWTVFEIELDAPRLRGKFVAQNKYFCSWTSLCRTHTVRWHVAERDVHTGLIPVHATVRSISAGLLLGEQHQWRVCGVRNWPGPLPSTSTLQPLPLKKTTVSSFVFSYFTPLQFFWLDFSSPGERSSERPEFSGVWA